MNRRGKKRLERKIREARSGFIKRWPVGSLTSRDNRIETLIIVSWNFSLFPYISYSQIFLANLYTPQLYHSSRRRSIHAPFTELREHPCIGVHWAQQHVLIILSSRCCPSDGTHDMANHRGASSNMPWLFCRACVQRINDGTHSVATNGKENTRKLVYHMWGSILKSAIDVLYYYLIFLKLELSFKPNSSKNSVKFIVELIHGGVGETKSWNRLVPNTPLGVSNG